MPGILIQGCTCIDMYCVLINNKKESISSLKNVQVLNLEIEWNNMFELPSKTSKESKFQWLKFQILHIRILSTNDDLFKLYVIGSLAFSFCNQDVESIEHFFG